MIDRGELFQFTNDLVKHVLEHYRNKILGDTLKDLVTQQRKKTGASHFVVGTNVFFEDGRVVPLTAVRFGTQAAKLDPELREQFDTFWQDYNDYNEGWQQVSQTLGSVMARAKNWQDVRDMLPDYVLAGTLNHKQLQGLQRTRPDIYAGHKDSPDYAAKLAERLPYWDPLLLNMYSRIGGIISVYLGYKFL